MGKGRIVATQPGHVQTTMNTPKMKRLVYLLWVYLYKVDRSNNNKVRYTPGGSPSIGQAHTFDDTYVSCIDLSTASL